MDPDRLPEASISSLRHRFFETTDAVEDENA
jgi:hypothetical protein